MNHSSEKIQAVGQSQFEQEVLKSPLLAVVDFWAAWCGPCRLVAPILEELAGEYEGRVRFFKVDVDQEREKAAEYQIRGIPAILFFKEGKVVDQMVGAQPKEALAKTLQKWL